MHVMENKTKVLLQTLTPAMLYNSVSTIMSGVRVPNKA